MVLEEVLPMKHQKLLLGWGLLLAFSLACAAVGQVLPVGGAQAFSAQAGSPALVSLEWPAMAGAEGYLLEGRYGTGEFFEVAQPGAGATGFTHFVVPGSAQVSYRLSAVTDGNNKEVGSLDVEIPALAPNPLVIL